MSTPQELYEVLEKQRRLQDLRLRLSGVLEKVNQSINAITVENLELTSSQIDNLKNYDDEIKQESKPLATSYNAVEQEKKAEEINQQLIDLETKFSHFEDIESDEELDF